MRRLNPFLIVTGLIGLVANLLAIAGYLTGRQALGGWHPDPGLLAALTFVLLAYSLIIWSALTWRWMHLRAEAPTPTPRRAAMALLNALVAFPLLTFWLDLLFSIVLYVDVPPAQRWLLALLHAALVAPLVALACSAIAEALGPLLTSRG
jgi:hypothetical protein